MVSGFDPSNYKVTTSQVWIRMHELLLEYRKEQNVLNIARGVGLPLRINPLMISLYRGLYARVLVDIDFMKPLSERILAKMIDNESGLDISFFVPITYERQPKFYCHCSVFTYETIGCKKRRVEVLGREDKEGRKLQNNKNAWRENRNVILNKCNISSNDRQKTVAPNQKDK